MVLLLVATLLIPSGGFAQASGNVKGRVTSDSTGDGLTGAIVELLAGSVSRSTITDATGRYELVGVPPGRSLLRVRYLGHAALDLQIAVTSGESLVVDLSLRVLPVPLAPVDVVNTDVSTRQAVGERERDPELGIAGARALGGTPGLAELGLTEAGQGLPDPEPEPGDPGSVLYVRGAANDLKLVYLDGAPVYAPFPLGGLLDPFTPGVLGRADIYLGGAPARYDGGLSYVMDLRSRASMPHGVRAEGAVDLLSARALLEGGIGGRAGVLATLRGVHSGVSSGVLGDPLVYGYREGFIRVDARVTETTAFAVTGFGNGESVGLGRTASRDSTIEWGNTAGSVRLATVVGGTSAELTAAAGEYAARLPLPGDRGLVADGRASRTRIAADLVAAASSLLIRYGGSIDYQNYRAIVSTASTGWTTSYSEGGGAVAGVYMEGSGHIGPRLRLRLGGRVDHFSASRATTFAPRFSATWMPTAKAALTLAAGRYHQFLRPPDEAILAAAAGPSQGIGQPLVVGSASHLLVSLDQDLGEGVRLGVEGFYKYFTDVPGALAGDANASGVDVWARKGAGPWSGWLGYSLAWAWSVAGDDGSTDFRGRHLLSSGLAAKLGERTDVVFRFAYGAGLPYSAVPLEPGESLPARQSTNFASGNRAEVVAASRGGTETAPLLPPPDRPFLRVDAGVSQVWTPRLAGRETVLRPYLKLLNGLGRRDALFYYYDSSDPGAPRPIGGFPIVPVAGMEWRF